MSIRNWAFTWMWTVSDAVASSYFYLWVAPSTCGVRWPASSDQAYWLCYCLARHLQPFLSWAFALTLLPLTLMLIGRLRVMQTAVLVVVYSGRRGLYVSCVGQTVSGRCMNWSSVASSEATTFHISSLSQTLDQHYNWSLST